jgi:hypothetical protein
LENKAGHRGKQNRENFMTEVSLVRLYLLRVCYGLLFVGLSLQYWPSLLGNIAGMTVMEGAATAFFCAIALLALPGIFSPLRFLPLLMFEVVWKVIWLLAVALPRWKAGQIDAAFGGALFAVSFVIPFILVMPWRYIFKTYLGHMERWR